MKTLRIRNAEPQDLPGVQALYQELANASHNVAVPQQQPFCFSSSCAAIRAAPCWSG